MEHETGRGAAPASGEGESSREFNLEPRHLTVLVVLLLGLCLASFMLGRWVERRASGSSASSLETKAPPGAIEEGGDVAKDLTFFDSLKKDEPEPLTLRSEPPPRTRAVPSQAATTPSASGERRSVGQGVMIQVMASKDRGTAEALRKRLRSRGYTALMVKDGGSYKVRVGPYADRAEAERAGALLSEQEKVQVWIP